MAEKIDPLEMLLHMGRAMDKIIEEVLKEIRAEKYDYVIYDNNFAAGWIIADILRIPKVCSCTTFAINSQIFSMFMKNRGEIDKGISKIHGNRTNFKKMERSIWSYSY
ncbi:hypothetical protein COM81_17645 [Priestia megaterium]|jgi:hypothetical protein|nr:hypothetical protein COM81_17645 [Priestia megaterium]PGR11591.1 hypothetical protein COC62_13270 [Priestia megaterium]